MPLHLLVAERHHAVMQLLEGGVLGPDLGEKLEATEGKLEEVRQRADAYEADVVICVGTRLTDLITGSHSLFQNPGVRFVDLNVDASDANKLSGVPVLAGAQVALEEISAGLADRGWSTEESYREEVAAAKESWDADLRADLVERSGERMSQAQVIEALNAQTGPGDVVIGGAGTVPVDMLKLWDCTNGSECHLEFGFSCMGHEIPAGLGVRLARPEKGEIYVFIGDGNYLMANTELVTAVQEGLKVTVVLVENGGHQSIHALQRDTTGTSFATEYRRRTGEGLTGEYLSIDFAANARSYGCAAFEADDLDGFREALRKARGHDGPSMIVAHVEPLRLMLDSGCWWDVGVAQVSRREASERVAAGFAEQRALIQRGYLRPSAE